MKKPVCSFCSRKLMLSEQEIKCRCGNHFCSNHRYFEDHNCSFDFQAEELKNLSKSLIEGKTEVIKLEKI